MQFYLQLFGKDLWKLKLMRLFYCRGLGNIFQEVIYMFIYRILEILKINERLRDEVYKELSFFIFYYLWKVFLI